MPTEGQALSQCLHQVLSGMLSRMRVVGSLHASLQPTFLTNVRCWQHACDATRGIYGSEEGAEALTRE
eukprot:281001-Prorocentrum_minimum.AAC.1